MAVAPCRRRVGLGPTTGEPAPCTGGTPRPEACSPPCSPSFALRPCPPRERDGNTDEAVHDTPTALHHGRSHRTDSSTSRRQRRGLRPSATPSARPENAVTRTLDGRARDALVRQTPSRLPSDRTIGARSPPAGATAWRDPHGTPADRHQPRRP